MVAEEHGHRAVLEISVDETVHVAGVRALHIHEQQLTVDVRRRTQFLETPVALVQIGVDRSDQIDHAHGSADLRLRLQVTLETVDVGQKLGILQRIRALTVDDHEHLIAALEGIVDSLRIDVVGMVRPQQRSAGQRIAHSHAGGVIPRNRQHGHRQHQHDHRPTSQHQVAAQVQHRAQQPAIGIDREGRGMRLGDPRQQGRHQHHRGHCNGSEPNRPHERSLLQQRHGHCGHDGHGHRVYDHTQHAGTKQCHQRLGSRLAWNIAALELIIERRQHLDGMRDSPRRHQECHHDDQWIKIDAHHTGDSKCPQRADCAGQHRQQHAAPGSHRDEQQRRHDDDGDQEQVEGLRQVMHDPAGKQGLAHHAYVDTVAVELLGNRRDRVVKLFVVDQAVDEIGRDQRGLQVGGDITAINQRIGQDVLAQLVYFFLRLWQIRPHHGRRLDAHG